MFLAATVLIAMLLVLVGMVSACSKSPDDSSDADLKMITTLFVSFDFARSIAGDQADVRMLMPAGVDVHAYEPSPQDIILLNEADLFIYNGGSSGQPTVGIRGNKARKYSAHDGFCGSA